MHQCADLTEEIREYLKSRNAVGHFIYYKDDSDSAVSHSEDAIAMVFLDKDVFIPLREFAMSGRLPYSLIMHTDGDGLWVEDFGDRKVWDANIKDRPAIRGLEIFLRVAEEARDECESKADDEEQPQNLYSHVSTEDFRRLEQTLFISVKNYFGSLNLTLTWILVVLILIALIVYLR